MSTWDSGPSGNAFEPSKPGTPERALVEARIEELRARGGVFVDAVRATRMPMAASDPSLPGNPIVFANAAFLNLSGYSMEEVLGQQPHFMNGDDTDPDDALRFRQALEQDRDEAIETIQYRKDRSRFVASVFISAFKDAGGRTLFQFLSWHDVTARVAAENELLTRSRLEAELRESEQRYRTLFENMAQGYSLAEIVRDKAGAAKDVRLIELNPAFERLMGLSADEARGRCIYELFPDVDRWWLHAYDRIVRNGQPERVEHRVDERDAWFEAWVYPRDGDRYEVLFEDITERKRSEIAGRRSEERQAFLLKLSDALRAEPDADAVARRALRLLFDHLHLDRCHVGVYRLADDIGDFPHQVAKEGMPLLPASVRLSDYPDALRTAFDRTVAIDDVATSESLSDVDRASFSALGVCALVAATLHAGEHNPLWAIVAASASPRVWTKEEIALIESVTERTWAAVERCRADSALRQSEERYRLILESARDYAIFTTDPDGMIDSWPAGAQAVFGWTAAEAIGQPMEITFVPEDVANGEPAREREIARRHGRAPNVRWRMRKDGSRVFIDGVAFSLRTGGELAGFLKVGRDTTERREWEERQRVLVAELQHRTRNLMGVVRAIAENTIRSSTDLADFRQRFRDRLQALSRVQGLLSRLNEHDRVTFDDLIRTELSAIHGDSRQIELEGPKDVRLRSSTLQTLAMAIHELATNAVKYGALSQPQARLSVTWRLEPAKPGAPPWLRIEWRESGVEMTAPSDKVRRSGQGTELIERALPYQLGARTAYVMGADGVRCTITIPVSGTMQEADDGRKDA